MTTTTLPTRAAADVASSHRAASASELRRRLAERVASPVLLIGLLLCVLGYVGLAVVVIRAALTVLL